MGEMGRDLKQPLSTDQKTCKRTETGLLEGTAKIIEKNPKGGTTRDSRNLPGRKKGGVGTSSAKGKKNAPDTQT